MSETNKQNYFAQDVDFAKQELQTSEQGISASEAKARLEKYGPNEIQEGKKKSTLEKFIDQFKDLMIIILLIAAALSVVLEGSEGMVDAIIILAVVLINAIMGVIQENKAEDAIDALKEMSSPQANVIRDGEQVAIDSKEIVPGDVVVLEAGDVVPADIRLFKATSLQIEEAALTGESVPVTKELGVVDSDAGIGDRTNMAFSSTNVTYGRGQGIVTGTGMDTEVGNIAEMLEGAEGKTTPLQENLDALTKFLTYAIVAIAVFIFVIGLINGREWVEMLLTAISIAVAALPEGLPAITTIILALGTQKMADRNALIRKLPAVETLGGTEVICSDKTGTLTQNKMTIEKVYYNGQLHDASEEISFDEPVFRVMNMANDTSINNAGELAGDPTETAMIQFGMDKGFDVKAVLADQPRVGEVPFDSDRKMSSTVHPSGDQDQGQYISMTKGAPDVLIANCNYYYDNGEIKELTDDVRQQLLDTNHDMATQALRVLAMAFKYWDQEPAAYDSETLENDLVFAGLVGEIDPERPEAKDAIARAKGAGIRTVMITGDHKDTASAIAARLGIIEEGDEAAVTTGAHLNEISDEELAQKVDQYSVYARVSPEHKVRIVKAWQSHDKVVAMTGDGVNDAPSLKQSDIGVGMGITGTEVSKGASDMVLADDNFATIVTAVEEGRKVFANIQKAVQFLLSANLGEVTTLFVATMLNWQILEPIHILWINLVTDTFPAIALGLEAAEADVMDHTPRGRQSNLLSAGVLPSIVYQGLYEGAITLFVFWFARVQMQVELVDAEAMAFLTLAFIQLFHAFNSKSVFKSLFSHNPFDNKWLNIGVGVSTLLMLVTVFVPGLNDAFGTVHLVGDPRSTEMWTVILLASASIILYVEIVKAILRATGLAAKWQDNK
ncbi:cation-translocating P-type ATPase [Aerococcus kribbianus]|uniref:P-type Ca(2+) transporter n=1 Tax=Aerococcus kribbianus TaxID=2999064 RepID=A0A9X3JEU3_9LACT|nr:MULTISPECIES: cation-translocating P-type ATPase [unclassified Aerococcus]MCZ0716988.1 cation-translocating P-type ATPase [Aerococcus sp. YH-aer221]MCZ0725276.1 cation-translocating P-type ATPase [Aerococcus sp. YH-aer222]